MSEEGEAGRVSRQEGQTVLGMQCIGMQGDAGAEPVGAAGIIPGVQDVTGHLHQRVLKDVTTGWWAVERLVSELIKVGGGTAEQLFA